jgi:hypothetical protein
MGATPECVQLRPGRRAGPLAARRAASGPRHLLARRPGTATTSAGTRPAPAARTRPPPVDHTSPESAGWRAGPASAGCHCPERRWRLGSPEPVNRAAHTRPGPPLALPSRCGRKKSQADGSVQTALSQSPLLSPRTASSPQRPAPGSLCLSPVDPLLGAAPPQQTPTAASQRPATQRRRNRSGARHRLRRNPAAGGRWVSRARSSVRARLTHRTPPAPPPDPRCPGLRRRPDSPPARALRPRPPAAVASRRTHRAARTLAPG